MFFNDQSTDKTAEIVQHFSALDHRIKLIDYNHLPVGWLGKNYACHSLALHAKGEYFLFLDADVRIGNRLIKNSIEYAKKYKLGLISIFPKQIMISVGELITIPNMNYILLSLLPLIMVRKSKRPSVSAANGQFMFFNASTYLNILPHEKMKASKVEDIEIARYYKKCDIPIACLIGDNSISCRMYGGLNDAINGFSKNVITFFGNSFLVALLFWIVGTFGFLFVLIGLGVNVTIIYLTVILMTRILISISSKQNIVLNLLFFIPQQITLGLFILKAFNNKISKQYIWKGRNISQS